jgi:hypothetical protein
MQINKISFSKIENKERVYTISFTLYPVTEEQDSHNVNAPVWNLYRIFTAIKTGAEITKHSGFLKRFS